MPVTFYDPKTGEARVVDAAAAQAGFANGSLGPAKDQQVRVRSTDGSQWDVPGDELHIALGKGSTIVDPDAERHAALVEEQSGVGGAVEAFGQGALESVGPVLGLARQGIGAISPSAGKRFQEHIEATQEAHPLVRFAGGIAGGVAQAEAGVGPSAALGTVGAAAGKVAVRTLPTTLSPIARKGIEAVARGVVEGGIYSASQAVDETMLGDKDLLAEKWHIAGSTVKGAIFAGAFGGVLGTGLAAREARKGAATLTREIAAAKGAEAAESVATAEARLQAAQDLEATAREVTKAPPTPPPVPAPKAATPLGPSSHLNPEAYPTPHIVEPLDVNSKAFDPSQQVFGPDGQRLPPPKDLPRPFSLGSMVKKTDPMASGTRYSDPLQWEGPSTWDPNAINAPRPDLGIESLAPSKPGTPFKIRTDKAQFAANEELRRGGVPLPPEAPPPVPEYTPHSFAKALSEGKVLDSLADQQFRINNAQEIEAHLLEFQAHQQALAKVEAAQQELLEAQKAHAETGTLDEAAVAARSGLTGKIRQRVWEAFGANTALNKKIGQDGADRAADTAIRKGVFDTAEAKGMVDGLKHSFEHNTPEKMLERTQSAMVSTGEELGVMGSANTSVTLRHLVEPIDREIQRLSQTATGVDTAYALDAFRRKLLSGAPVRDAEGALVAGELRSLDTPLPFSQLVLERQQLAQQVYEVGNVNASIAKKARQKIWQRWSDLEGEALDSLALSAGGEGVTGAQFKATKTTYADLATIEKALEGKIAGMSANRRNSLTDHIVGGIGAAIGSIIGGAVVPVAGHALGGASGGVIAAMINKAGREHGNAATAVAMMKIRDLGAVRGMENQVDRAIGKAAKGLATPREPKVRVVGSAAPEHRTSDREPLNDRYRAAIKDLDQMVAHPVPLEQRVSLASQEIATQAPNVASAYALTVSRAAAFLTSKRPEALVAPGPFDMHQEPSVQSTEKLSYLRSYEAVKNPMGVFKAFERGEVTPEAAEALKATAPKVYNQLRDRTMEEVAKKGTKLPFRQRVTLSLLFDIPMAELEPSMYKTLQENVSMPASPPEGKKAGRGGPRNSIKLTSQVSPLDALTQKGPGRK